MAVLVGTETEAYLLLERLRWGAGPVSCPGCGEDGRTRYLAPRRAPARRTRTGADTARRVWKCSACTRQFSVLTATVLEGTRLPLRTWLGLVADLSNGEHTGPADLPSLARRHATTVESARRVLRCLTLALDDPSGSGLPPVVDGAALALLTRLIRLDPQRVREIRRSAGARRHPHGQVGPMADHGGP